jgi:hypothetical protein
MGAWALETFSGKFADDPSGESLMKIWTTQTANSLMDQRPWQSAMPGADQPLVRELLSSTSQPWRGRRARFFPAPFDPAAHTKGQKGRRVVGDRHCSVSDGSEI